MQRNNLIVVSATDSYAAFASAVRVHPVSFSGKYIYWLTF